jgi:hypothetical protein
MPKALLVVIAVLMLGFVARGEQSPAELLAQAQALVPQRYVTETLYALIDLLERALALAGEDPAIQAALVQHYYELGVILGEGEEARAAFRRGADLGFAALGLTDLNTAEGMSKEEFQAHIQAADRVALVYWTAKCWGTLVDQAGILAQLNAIAAGMPAKIQAMYLRAIELDEAYFGGGPHEDYGALLVNLSAFRLLGATMEQAKWHLDRAVSLAAEAGYLIPFITYAQEYAVAVRDRVLFEDLLAYVLEAPIGEWPFWNRHAKVMAQDLLARVEELF